MTETIFEENSFKFGPRPSANMEGGGGQVKSVIFKKLQLRSKVISRGATQIKRFNLQRL